MKKLNYGRTILIGKAFSHMCVLAGFRQHHSTVTKGIIRLRDAATNSIMALTTYLLVPVALWFPLTEPTPAIAKEHLT